MKTQVIFMYSGQGSQFYNMGIELYQSNDLYRSTICKMDEIFQDKLGYSIVSEIYCTDKNYGNPFHNIAFSHGAIFMVEYALTSVLKNYGVEPDYVAGCSLGEFSALLAADVISYEQAVELIIFQVKLLLSQPLEPGGMSAVLEDISLFEELKKNFSLELAAYNYDTHFVVSGLKEDLNRMHLYLMQKKIIAQSLPVDFAFHSSHIKPAESVYKEYVKGIGLREAKIPVISGIDGSLRTSFDTEYLWNIIREPMDFTKTAGTMVNTGANMFIDTGTSGTMAGFMKKNLPDFLQGKVFSVLTPFCRDIDNINQIITKYVGGK